MPSNLAGQWFTRWSRDLTNLIHYITTTRASMVIRLDRMMNWLELILPIELLDPSSTCSCDISWQTNAIISLLPQCQWSSNLQDGDLPRTLHYHWTTWSFKIPWQTKAIMSSLLQGLWSLNLAGMWLTMRSS